MGDELSNQELLNAIVENTINLPLPQSTIGVKWNDAMLDTIFGKFYGFENDESILIAYEQLFDPNNMIQSILIPSIALHLETSPGVKLYEIVNCLEHRMNWIPPAANLENENNAQDNAQNLQEFANQNNNANNQVNANPVQAIPPHQNANKAWRTNLNIVQKRIAAQYASAYCMVLTRAAIKTSDSIVRAINTRCQQVFLATFGDAPAIAIPVPTEALVKLVNSRLTSGAPSLCMLVKCELIYKDTPGYNSVIVNFLTFANLLHFNFSGIPLISLLLRACHTLEVTINDVLGECLCSLNITSIRRILKFWGEFVVDVNSKYVGYSRLFLINAMSDYSRVQNINMVFLLQNLISKGQEDTIWKLQGDKPDEKSAEILISISYFFKEKKTVGFINAPLGGAAQKVADFLKNRENIEEEEAEEVVNNGDQENPNEDLALEDIHDLFN